MRSYRENLTAEYVRRMLNYDEKTGVFTNKVNRTKAKAGDIAGYQRPDRYWSICIGGERYLAHRLAWLYVTGEWPGQVIDHIDRDPSNNAIANLRACSDSENAQNQSGVRRGPSGYLGVTRYFRDPTKWVAKIKLYGKAQHLGVYRCRTAAYVAYCKAKKSLHVFATGGAGAPAVS